uniref:Uncharacterized protein n=1 Tax=Hyaloperonospora arabidopsidis (strain Emoy2) TaxID=559515 RepID=M4BRR7_HYAAE
MASDLVQPVSTLLPSTNLSNVTDRHRSSKTGCFSWQMYALICGRDWRSRLRPKSKGLSLLFDAAVVAFKPEHEFPLALNSIYKPRRRSVIVCVSGWWLHCIIRPTGCRKCSSRSSWRSYRMSRARTVRISVSILRSSGDIGDY